MKSKEQKAIEFIKKISKNIPDIHLAFSGGKDSVVLYQLALKAEIKFKAYYCNTTIDPTGTIPFIKKNYPNVQILQPNKDFYKLVKDKGLPTRLNRYCCQHLKEYGSINKNVLEGVRSAESRKRQNRDYIQCDSRKWQKGAQHIYPIYDWSDSDVWSYINQYNLPVAPCYINGATRLGCVGCPLISTKKRISEFLKEPKKFYKIKKSIEIGMSNNPQWKLTKLCNGDANIAMDWWLSNKTMNEFDFTEKLFEVKTIL